MTRTFWELVEDLEDAVAVNNRKEMASILEAATELVEQERGEVAAVRRSFLEDFCARAGLADILEGIRSGAMTKTLPQEAIAPGMPLPPITPEGRAGVSLVSCCMNRESNLVKALDSWLACPEVSEIVIVDWSSARPVRDVLDQAGIGDPRIRVARVEGESRWILSFAFNTGFRLATCERILKVDADIVVSPGFFSRNKLKPGHFIAGNWRIVEEEQAYVNGFFLAWKADLAAVAGFNEYITTYGWDDDDLYDRLIGVGRIRQDISGNTIHHLPHSDAERLGDKVTDRSSALEELTHNPMHKIRQNRLLSYIMPVWDCSHTLLPLQVESVNGPDVTLRRCGPLPHPVPPHVQADVHFYAMQEMASWRLGRGIWALDRSQLSELLERPFSEITEDDIAAVRGAASRVSAPNLALGQERLFIDAQHGLGNRMRAIASAAILADKSGRELVIVWQPDEHCDCRFSDLFEYDGAVIEESFVERAGAQGCRLYNYMEVEEGALKDAEIDLSAGCDIYARSAYVLNSALSSWEDENRFLRSLRPVRAVRDLVASVRHPNDVSAHVRMAGGPAYEHLPYESRENWTDEGHAEIARWREKSHFSGFMKRIDCLFDEGRAERIFLAADTPEAYAAFRDRYGDRLAALERGLYDRSAEQLRYALADAILLGQSPLLLGSTWSSFSELAMRLAPKEMTVEMSGKDF